MLYTKNKANEIAFKVFEELGLSCHFKIAKTAGDHFKDELCLQLFIVLVSPDNRYHGSI